jgi:hypothetical protein
VRAVAMTDMCDTSSYLVIFRKPRCLPAPHTRDEE